MLEIFLNLAQVWSYSIKKCGNSILSGLGFYVAACLKDRETEYSVSQQGQIPELRTQPRYLTYLNPTTYLNHHCSSLRVCTGRKLELGEPGTKPKDANVGCGVLAAILTARPSACPSVLFLRFVRLVQSRAKSRANYEARFFVYSTQWLVSLKGLQSSLWEEPLFLALWELKFCFL